MIDYKKGKIYGIYSNSTEKIYIGSTTQLLCKRNAKHNGKYKEWLKGSKYYTTSFEILKYGDSYIELIENCSCNSKEELYKKEGYYIRKFKNTCVNKCIPNNKNQWLIDNKDILKIKNKQFRLDNKDILQERKKIYYEENKELIKKKVNDRYHTLLNEKIICECYMDTTIGALKTHIKTLRHNELMKLTNDEDEQFKCECGLFIKKCNKVIKRHQKSKIHITILNNKFYKKIYNFIFS